MNKYEIRTQNKKDAIINTAVALFQEKGFVAVGIRQIAEIAQVSQASIYNYFGSKEALVGVCINALMRETFEQVRQLLAEKMDFKTKLIKAFALCEEGIHKRLHDYFSSVALDDEVWVNLYNENTKQLKSEVFIEYIMLGKKEGFIDESISTEAIINYLEVMGAMEYTTGGIGSQPSFADDFLKLTLYGLIGR
ncbi:TetR/AcrR family transcriptional regulator [Lachnospiraceae bacterium ZAX-1]